MARAQRSARDILCYQRIHRQDLVLEKSSVFIHLPRQKEILGFLIRVIKIYSVLLAPFVPTLTAKINFTLGCSDRLEDGSMVFEGGIKSALLSCLEGSTELKEPIPLVKASTIVMI